jgi:hypothetical protein
VLDFRSPVFLRLLATGWVGTTVGLVADSWGATTEFVSLVYGVTMATYAWLGWEPPSRAVADLWEELNGRERRAVTRAVWSGSEPQDPRLAGVAAAAREAHSVESPASTRQALLLGLKATAALTAVVLAAVNNAPAGWLVAGAILPLAVITLGAVSLGGRTRPA